MNELVILTCTPDNGYRLVLKNVPPLTEKFLRVKFGDGGGMTACAAAKLLDKNGYRSPKAICDRQTGRVLGHQSTLRNWGTLEW